MFHTNVLQGGLETRGDLVRLQTLSNLRWMAIAGQMVALIVGSQYFGLDLPLGLCLTAVLLSVLVNIASAIGFPQNTRLSDTGTVWILLFDLMQLLALLSVTGGLTNPFALLVIAPVTISASALRLGSTVFLAATAIVAITVLLFFHLPLHFEDGRAVVMPDLLRFGFWLSLVIGILFMAVYARRVATETRAMSDALFATQMALGREQKLTDLGGVVAAAAHELGTPLATIKLVSTELMDELEDRADLQKDAALIREQADRCRDILRSMGRAGKEDLHLMQAPLTAVVREAAEPHIDRGKQVRFAEYGVAGLKPPIIGRRPELVHGLRNLVQNAVDFAAAKVWVEVVWDDETASVEISDDGAGFPAQMISRIGDPFLKRRTAPEPGLRREYEGMGLGLFIAKTLLERTGGKLTFMNGSDPFLSPQERPEKCGAVVRVTWPISAILGSDRQVQGSNPPIYR